MSRQLWLIWYIYGHRYKYIKQGLFLVQATSTRNKTRSIKLQKRRIRNTAHSPLQMLKQRKRNFSPKTKKNPKTTPEDSSNFSRAGNRENPEKSKNLVDWYQVVLFSLFQILARSGIVWGGTGKNSVDGCRHTADDKTVSAFLFFCQQGRNKQKTQV